MPSMNLNNIKRRIIIEKISWARRESNPGPLGTKRECYPWRYGSCISQSNRFKCEECHARLTPRVTKPFQSSSFVPRHEPEKMKDFDLKNSQWSLDKKKVLVLVSMDLMFLAFLYLAAWNVVSLPRRLRFRLALSNRKTKGRGTSCSLVATTSTC